MMNEALMLWLMTPEATESAKLVLEDFLERPAWHQDAACRGLGPKEWFTGAPEYVERARAVCRGCVVQAECAEFAMADPDLTGVWAGMTATERRELRGGRVA
jgi:WhiB family redox-sensing transcriptional regulator